MDGQLQVPLAWMRRPVYRFGRRAASIGGSLYVDGRPAEDRLVSGKRWLVGSVVGSGWDGIFGRSLCLARDAR